MRAYRQFGEQEGIGCSAHFLQIDGKTIVIDWGASFNDDGDRRISVSPAGSYLREMKVDLLILTHPHWDHLGGVPRFVRYHPETAVLMPRSAVRIAEIMIRDAVKIAMREQEAADRKGHAVSAMVTPQEMSHFFTTDQIQMVCDKEWVEPWSGWKIGFHPAGHAIGAHSVFIDPPKSGPVFVTGDICAHDQRTLPGVMLPDEEFLGDLFERPDILMITEATNGSRDPIRPRAEEERLLLFEVRRTLDQGGVALLSTFAYARSTEAALICEQAGIVPYVEGMAVRCMEVECPRLIAEKKVAVLPHSNNEDEWNEINAFRDELACGEHGSAVIIAPSGTLNGGYAVKYAQWVLPDPRSAIFFLGHIFENSGAECVLQTPRGYMARLLRYDGQPLPVELQCAVYQHDFTAHDYRRAIVERIHRVAPKALIIHHRGRYEGVDGYDGLMAALRERHIVPPFVFRADHMVSVEVD